ncbi:MAG: hypothetical protein MPJ50_00945 [Pirellulales bacterium]|nr:hypothetical protein [Pirellulales bacterium]
MTLRTALITWFFTTGFIPGVSGAHVQQSLPPEVAAATQRERSTPKDEEQPDASFRDVLAARGVDASQLSHMFDDRPFSVDEQETLERTLAALVNLPPSLIDLYAMPETSLPNFMTSPDEHRGELIQLAGRVKACRAIAVAPELRERLGFSVIFRCAVEVAMGESHFTCDVFSPIAPANWVKPADNLDEQGRSPLLDESVAFKAVFLKRASVADAPARPVLATRRLTWFPDTLLGRSGFDVATFEEVVPDGAITPSDAGAFHGLLAVLRGVGRQDLEQAARETLSTRELGDLSLHEASRHLVVEFMARPVDWCGEIVSLQGIARRALKIHVQDEELIEALGVREYYEIEVFVDGPFRLPGFDDAVGRYPVTVCTTSLPPELIEGELLSVPVRLTGVYLKNWRYRSTMYAQQDAGSQRAPLIVGGVLEKIPDELGQGAFLWGERETIIAASVASVLIIAAFFCWRWRRNDKISAKRRASVLQRSRGDRI